jgi:ATP-binding cassette, subfamily B, multidrug efflux pump
MTTRHRLLPYVLPYWKSFALGLACAIVTTTATLTIPRVLKYAVDSLEQPGAEETLRQCAAAVVALALLAWASYRFMRQRVYHAARAIEYDIRQALFARLSRLPQSYLSTSRTGDVVSRVAGDVEFTCIAIGPSAEAATLSALTFVSGAAFLVALDPKLTAMALIPVLPGTLLLAWFARTVHARFGEIRAELATLHATIQEGLVGVRLVKAYAREPHQVALFDDVNQRYLRRQQQLILLQSLFYPSMALLLSLAWMPLIWYGGREVIAGRLTRGEFVAFVAYIPLLTWPTVSLGWFINGFQRGAAAWSRIRELFDESAGTLETLQPEEVSSAAQREPLRGQIDIKDLSYERGGRSMLSRVSLSLLPGQRISIVGASGSGKSSLLQLILRVHEPPRQTIFVDGRDVLDLPHDVLRKGIVLVQQEPFVFSGTIEQNVLLGRGRVDQDGRWDMSEDDRRTMQWALRIAALDGDLADFPAGTATVVGERGVTLSGGQKQRLALARTLVLQPRVLLLDDALSAVDVRTEQQILARLHEAIPGLTTLTVTNRVRSNVAAHQVLVMDRGAIVERGTHDELLARGGAYAAIFRREQLRADLAMT